jgi:tetratricopeptide (TPR) repeat protein
LTLSPEWSDAHYGIGLIALRKGEFQAACDSLRRAAALAPADPRVPDLLAEALARLGQYDEAEAVLQRVLKTGMPTARTHVQLGQVHLEKGDYAQAARVFEALVKQAPQHAQGHYGLARAYLRQGRREEARRHMERFKELDARRLADEIRDANAYADRETCRAALIRTLERAAHAYGRFGDLGSAEEMWRRLCRLQPRDVRCRDALLRLYEDQGRQSDALAVAREMCEIEPDGAAHWYNVAVLSGLAGRRDAAIAAARRAVELDPQNGRYRAVLQTLQEGR